MAENNMADQNEEDLCWICLEGRDAEPKHGHENRLMKPCKCPRVCHSVCLAKWQLSQAGKSEEDYCRFCKERLPNWQENLALPGMSAVEPVMSVHFNGATHMVRVRPGEEGRLAFIQDVRRLLHLRPSQEFSITFECKVPGHGMFLDLKGLSSYDAAVFCAAMTAVERQRLAAQKRKKAAAAAAAAAGPAQAQPNDASGAANQGALGRSSSEGGSGSMPPATPSPRASSEQHAHSSGHVSDSGHLCPAAGLIGTGAAAVAGSPTSSSRPSSEVSPVAASAPHGPADASSLAQVGTCYPASACDVEPAAADRPHMTAPTDAAAVGDDAAAVDQGDRRKGRPRSLQSQSQASALGVGAPAAEGVRRMPWVRRLLLCHGRAASD